MPHITLECSQNVKIDFKAFFETLTSELVATGNAPKLGMKCRLVKVEEYFIIDRSPDYKMANLLIRLREGRSDEVLSSFSKIGMDTMELFFKDDCLNKSIILSTEIKELKKGLDLTKNYIRKRFE